MRAKLAGSMTVGYSLRVQPSSWRKRGADLPCGGMTKPIIRHKSGLAHSRLSKSPSPPPCFSAVAPVSIAIPVACKHFRVEQRLIDHNQPYSTFTGSGKPYYRAGLTLTPDSRYLGPLRPTAPCAAKTHMIPSISRSLWRSYAIFNVNC